ncbi:hypothetical protein DFH06DRAFT_1023774 [Mycena polygramma]|nr:hypothetical protein DFH06DRAFT_1023774 [Mycena polygramma]
MLASLQADRARVADLEPQILYLERSLSALRSELALAQGRLNSYTYPVLTLPTDIISEIFIQCLPVYPNCSWLADSYLPPARLTQICHYWRELALATPTLWRAIRFPPDGAPVLKKLDLWLTRSRNCLLSIEINDSLGYASVPDAIALVLSHRERWEYAEFDVHPSQLAAFQGPLPVLRSLDLRLTADPDSSIVAFHDAPLLRTVALRRFDWMTIAKIVLPWAQLTSLTLDNVLPHQCYQVLRCTPNLVHLNCMLTSDAPDDSTYHGPDIELPCLESLELRLARNAEFTRFRLKALVAPALRCLEIQESSLAPDPIGYDVHSVHLFSRAFLSGIRALLLRIPLLGCLTLCPRTLHTRHRHHYEEYPRECVGLQPIGPAIEPHTILLQMHCFVSLEWPQVTCKDWTNRIRIRLIAGPLFRLESPLGL